MDFGEKNISLDELQNAKIYTVGLNKIYRYPVDYRR